MNIPDGWEFQVEPDKSDHRVVLRLKKGDVSFTALVLTARRDYVGGSSYLDKGRYRYSDATPEELNQWFKASMETLIAKAQHLESITGIVRNLEGSDIYA